MTDTREQEHRVVGSDDRRQSDGAGENLPVVSTRIPVHVRQPTKTSCAQACIAMITGVDVNALITRMKPRLKSGTRGAVIVRELRNHGIRCGDRFESLRGRPFPRFAIVRVVHPDKRGHVVVKHERTWFDPLLEGPFTGDPPRGAVTPWAGGSRITSALWIGDGCHDHHRAPSARR